MQLSTTKSLTCGSCASLINLDSGVGGELRAAVQDEPVQPIIPLGTKGQLQGVHWQVVGFQHRMGVEPGDDEHFGWSEYLLYNQKRWLSRSWSTPKKAGAWVRPTTGAPAAGVHRPLGHVHGHQVRPQVHLRGRNHLRAGRVSTGK